MPSKSEKKEHKVARVAFVISPIGPEDSTIRKRSDQILNYVVKPVISKLGYRAVRADKISKPGIITKQIIEHIINDALVIADLTDHNANVFYELAVRHTIRKPIIQIIEEGQVIPFDVSTSRTIYVNHKDLDSVEKAKDELEEQVKAVEKDPTLVDSPISMAIDLQHLKQSRDPEGKAITELTAYLQEISFMVKELYKRDQKPAPERKVYHPQVAPKQIKMFEKRGNSDFLLAVYIGEKYALDFLNRMGMEIEEISVLPDGSTRWQVVQRKRSRKAMRTKKIG